MMTHERSLVQDFDYSMRNTYDRIHDDMEALRSAGYQQLAWSQMPSKRLLQLQGYQEKISFFYRGASQDVALAELYALASRAGLKNNFNRIMLNKLKTDGHTELMQRFQLSAALLPLFRGQPVAIQHRVFHRLLEARCMLGLEKNSDTIALTAEAGPTLKYLLGRNKLFSFADLTPGMAALFTTFFVIDTKTQGDNNMNQGGRFRNWEKLNTYARLSYWHDGQGITQQVRVKSLPWRFYTLFTLDELEQLVQANLPGAEHWLVALDIRELVDDKLPLPNILDYLSLQLSIVYDMFPQLDKPYRF